MFAPGSELCGFRLERELGHGSSGTVYEATQVSLDRRVALKLLPPDPRLAQRVRRLQWPEHPHVVRMYAAGTSEHGHFVAMQLVRGHSLAELQEGGTLTRAQTIEILRGVATALDAAHAAGLAHGAVTAKKSARRRAGAPHGLRARFRAGDAGVGQGSVRGTRARVPGRRQSGSRGCHRGVHGSTRARRAFQTAAAGKLRLLDWGSRGSRLAWPFLCRPTESRSACRRSSPVRRRSEARCAARKSIRWTVRDARRAARRSSAP